MPARRAFGAPQGRPAPAAPLVAGISTMQTRKAIRIGMLLGRDQRGTIVNGASRLCLVLDVSRPQARSW